MAASTASNLAESQTSFVKYSLNKKLVTEKPMQAPVNMAMYLSVL
jgi:hypothetical protein